MREFKFRAYDLKKKEMFVPYLCEHNNINDAIDNLCYNMKGEVVVEFMQYTGLKDKNGKEIYEGDILEFTPDKTFGVVTTFGKANNLGVEWENNRTTIFTPLFYMQCEKELNILGNIHENKNLLK